MRQNGRRPGSGVPPILRVRSAAPWGFVSEKGAVRERRGPDGLKEAAAASRGVVLREGAVVQGNRGALHDGDPSAQPPAVFGGCPVADEGAVPHLGSTVVIDIKPASTGINLALFAALRSVVLERAGNDVRARRHDAHSSAEGFRRVPLEETALHRGSELPGLADLSELEQAGSLKARTKADA